MVHRPADSRLLTNLLRHEKDYTHSIISTIETSQSSLASLQAYASASHPASSHVILKVAASLAGADEALRKYTESIEQWRDKLAILKDLEDEVGNIMRDREILVNRLIKASKSQKPTRDSLIGGPPSPTSSYSKDAGSKLSVAKSELQSCETVLADKEQELEIARISLVREGLHQRCRAMVECGWAWGEMGKEGISALEGMGSSVANGNGSHIRHSSLSKHLYPDHTGSDISSITPSISASQLNYGRGSTSVESEPPPPLPPLKFNLDPPHSVSDHAMPIRSPLSKPIALSPDESSDTSEDEQAVEVVENPRFASTQSTKPTSHVHFPQKSSTRSDLGVRPSYAARQKEREQQVRKRSESSSFFGSIANLFRGPRSSGSVVSEPSSPVERSNSKRWSTRTDRNLARARRGDDDSDREDAGITIDYERLSREAKYLPKPPADGTPRDSTKLRKKGSTRKAAPEGSPSLPTGYHTDGVVSSSPKGKGKGKARPLSTGSISPPIRTSKPSQNPDTQTQNPTKSLHSSDTDLPRAASPNPASPVQSESGASTVRSGSVKRSNSGKRASKAGPTSILNSGGSQSLMSIVEGVSHSTNRDAWGNEIREPPENKMEVPKAPPSVSVGQVPLLPSPSTLPQVAPTPSSSSATVKPSVSAINTTPANVLTSAATPVLLSPQARTAQASTAPPIPLKSALRNRSPSPVRATRPGMSSIPHAPEDTADTDSISSAYETGQEDLDGEEDDDKTELSPVIPHAYTAPSSSQAPPPIGKDKPALARLEIDDRDELSSNSTARGSGSGTGSQPSRRKSVRMAPHPTFSPTPPALDDDEERDNSWGRDAPPGGKIQVGDWSIRNSTKDKDVWEDSSDDDTEYAQARKLLSKADKRLSKAGKI